MEVNVINEGKVVTKSLSKLIDEHKYLSDSTSWYICSLGEKLQEIQAENELLAEDLAIMTGNYQTHAKINEDYQVDNKRLKDEELRLLRRIEQLIIEKHKLQQALTTASPN